MLSGLAIAVSLFSSTFAIWRARQITRRNTFLDVHRRLLDDDLISARHKLRQIESVEDIEGLGSDGRSDIYRLLATFDLLGLYAEEGWVKRRTVLDEWSYSLAESKDPASHFLDYREGFRPNREHWPHYQSLVIYAVEHLDKVEPPKPRWTKRPKRRFWNR